jgi:hypothetical protein
MTFLARQSIDLPSLYEKAEVAADEPDPEGPAPQSSFWTEEEFAAVAEHQQPVPGAAAPEEAPVAAPQYAAGVWTVDEHGSQVWVPADAVAPAAPAPAADPEPAAVWAPAAVEPDPAPWVAPEPDGEG